MDKNKKIIVSVGAVLGAILVIYIGFSIYFMSHFYFRTTINGVDVSGASIEKAKVNIQVAMDEYELVITERDGTTDSIIGNEIALQIQWDNQVDEFMQTQNGFAWIVKVFAPDNHISEMKVSYDETMLSKKIAGLSCMEAGKQIMPVDAAISEYDAAKGYELVPSVQGTAINTSVFNAAIKSCITSLGTELILDASECYYVPAVLDDDERLLAAIEQLNKCVDTVVTYEIGETTQVLDASVFEPWLVVDHNFNVSIDDEQLSAYIKEMGLTYNTFGKPKTLKTSYGKTVTISNSRYGWKIDSETEKAAIMAEIMAGEKVTRDLNYTYTASSHEGNDYGNSYVEINLTAQHLFLYVNGVKIMESDFVSGNLSKGYDSPTGAYGLTYKEKDATLNGEDYSTPVSYWMPFAGNVGMHDATWRGSFGASIYKRNGSHGCINLPYSAAKTIYEHVETGFPVLVYNLAGTQSARGIAQDQAYEVIDAIKEIGTVTLESEKYIKKVRKQYDELSKTAKAYVTNYATLEAAEKQLEKLKKEAEKEKEEEEEKDKDKDKDKDKTKE